MPLPPSATLTIVAGDTFSATFTFKDTSNAVLNLTDSTFRAQWRPFAGAPVAVPFVVDASQAAQGVLVVTMSPALTATFNSPEGVWDLERTITASGAVTTMLAGTVSWVADVTR